MAGRPKRRARLEAEQRRHIGTAPTKPPQATRTPKAERDSEIPDALPSRARAGAHDARDRERERQLDRDLQRPGPRPLRSPLLGGATRTVADQAQAQTMLRLSELIKPGVEIRVERSRPTWAAGWLEDYSMDATGDALQDLYERLRDEHGGQLYKLTVLAPGQTPVYVGAVPIAGPVRDAGRVITRDIWEMGRRSTQDAAAAPSRAAPSAPAIPLEGIVSAVTGFLQMLMSAQKESAATQLQAVRDMMTSSQQQTSDLTAAVLQVRSEERTRSGLGSQMGELMEGITAVESLRKRFGAARGEEPQNDELGGALGEATKMFLGNVMQSIGQQRAQPRARVALRRPRPGPNAPPEMGRMRRTTTADVGSQPMGIPDAIAGQAPGTN